MKKIFWLSLIVPLICSCKFTGNSATPVATMAISDGPGLINYEYEDLGDKLVSWENISLIDREHYYVYFFSRTCSHCQRIKNLMIAKLLERRIYYACEVTNSVRFCSEMTDDVPPPRICIIGYPSIVEVKYLEVVKNVAGADEVLSFINSK